MGNLGAIQVPDIVLYRESAFDMAIIVFIGSINVAELIAHIIVSIDWFCYIDESSIDNANLGIS